ncbi:MAG: phage major capsid protein [Gammaproteobacteria bacterium]
MTALNEVQSLVQEFHETLTLRDGAINGSIDKLRARVSDIEIAHQRQGLGPTGGYGGEDRAELNKALRLYIRSGDPSGFHEKSMSVGDDSSGGYFVPSPLSRGILETIFNSSPIRQISRVVQISSDAYEEPESHSDLGAAWVEETVSRPETTTPEIGKIRIPAHECYANPAVTQKLLDDSQIDLAAWLTRRIGDKFGRMEAIAFISGDGITKPRGFLTYTLSTAGDDTRSWGTLQYVASGAAGAFAASNPGDKLIDLMASLKSGYLPGAVWVMSSSTLAAVRKLKDGQNNYLWQQSVIASEPSLLLGHRVILAEDMPALVANSLSLAFGNFEVAYSVIDRFPLRMLRDELTNKPRVHFYTFRRVGGDVVNYEAIKIMKFSTS